MTAASRPPVAIVGTGLIGRAWAMVFARAGHPVRLFDIADGAALRARTLIGDGLAALREAQLLDEAPAAVLARIAVTDSLASALDGAVYAQESTAERADVKRDVFTQLDAVAGPDCILASSTSFILASVFASHVPGRHRCLVAHPVNPPHIVPIVELAPAPFTSAEVVERCRALHEAAGQVPILVKREVEGFILNRLQSALLMEAWRLVGEDYVSVEDLDKTIRDGLGLRWAFMGPFETIDLNAPGGVADYGARYKASIHGMVDGITHEPWSPELIAKVEAERRALLPQADHDTREAWRDRRLMALVAHKRGQDKGHR
ncbi:MAG: 3-hydroxyacyl-CoA dehydrogenase [Burkholderiales bacterium]|jgi:3-hydroxyacyl-CoA dehydrogenase|nr:3-hydroxyacyl-CoA dehydrogenase [Burkholderiales bacterium]